MRARWSRYGTFPFHDTQNSCLVYIRIGGNGVYMRRYAVERHFSEIHAISAQLVFFAIPNRIHNPQDGKASAKSSLQCESLSVCCVNTTWALRAFHNLRSTLSRFHDITIYFVARKRRILFEQTFNSVHGWICVCERQIKGEKGRENFI